MPPKKVLIKLVGAKQKPRTHLDNFLTYSLGKSESNVIH